MTTDDLQRQIAERNWSRNELARRMKIDRRTIAKWFDDGEVPTKYEREVRAALGPPADILRGLSDTALLGELARRLAERDDCNSEVTDDPEISPDRSPGVSVTPEPTSVEGTAGPHSPPRQQR